MPADEPVFIDENHERIVAFATDFLDEEEREDFVDTMMERHGYERITGWGPPADPDPGNGRKPPVKRKQPSGGPPRPGGFYRRTSK